MAKSKKKPAPQIEPDPDTSGRIEARLTPLLDSALKNYMIDHHLENRSEVMKSALGQLLEREGYLVRTVCEAQGDYRISTPEERDERSKKIGFHSRQSSLALSMAAMTALSLGAVRLMLLCLNSIV